MSKLNFNSTVSIKELRKTIPLIGSSLTPIILSEPGCGKTSLLSMIAEDLGDAYDYIYVDCPVKDMSDVGMTIPNHQTQSLEYYVSSLFKLDSPKPKVILLDEFMKSPKLLQVIFTRLMLERMVGDRPLPSGSIVFGTSNNASDGVGDTMLAHAGNRVCIMEMSKPSVNEWLEWSSANGISRVVRAFVAMFPRVLASYRDGNQDDNPYVFNPKKTALSFCSPRSLAKCDVIVKNRDILGDNATMVALAGTIGASGAGDMSAFLSLEKTLVDVKDIVKSPDSIKVPEEISAQLMIMFQAVDVLETQDELTKFMTFVNKIPSSEVQAVFFTMMMRNTKSIKLARNNMQIAEWAKNNHELF
jgi:ATPase family associated with various cellular activities (AAA)